MNFYLLVCSRSGHIIGTVETAFPERHENPGARVVPVDRGVVTDDRWYNLVTGIIAPREHISVTVDKPIIAADGVDQATIAGLPDDAWCIGDDLMQALDGTAIVRSSTPRSIPVIGRGRYAFSVSIEAV